MTEMATESLDSNTLTGDALDAVVRGTAKAQFADALRPQSQPPANSDTKTEEARLDVEPTETADADTLSWLLAEARHQLDNPDPNSEAARHRVARRDAEAKAATVATQLESMQRAAIDEHVKRLGIKAEAFWAINKREDVLDESGSPDPKKIEQGVAAAREQLGIFRPTARQQLGSLQSGASAAVPKRDPWTEAFSPGSR